MSSPHWVASPTREPSKLHFTLPSIAALLNAAPTAVYVLFAGIGLTLGVFHWSFDESPSFVLLEKVTSWRIDLFAAFGTMSGFALAALALVASLSTSDRAKEVVDSDSGRYLVRTLLRSAILWFVAAVLSLLAVFTGSRALDALVIAAACVAVGGGVVMMLGLYLFMRPFTVEKP
jgi:hypothetical protein